MDNSTFEKYYNDYLSDKAEILEKINKYKRELELISTSNIDDYINRVLNDKITICDKLLVELDIEECRKKYAGTKFLDSQLKLLNTRIKNTHSDRDKYTNLLAEPYDSLNRKKFIDDLVANYREYIYREELYISERDKKMEAERKYQETRKKTLGPLDVNEIGQRKLLNNKITQKFANAVVDSNNLSDVSKCIRSMDAPVDKYKYLHECRKYEVENELQTFETTEALTVLDRYIMISMPNGKYPKDENYNHGDIVQLEELYKLVELIIDDPYFTSTEKYTRAVAFFIGDIKDYAYKLFYKLLISPLTRILEKIESCKFLYYSGNDTYIPDIRKYTTEFIEDNTIDDKLRFEAIACYISNLGLKSKYIDFEVPIREGVDEELVVDLFQVFIRQVVHPDKLILAYTFLLEQQTDNKIKPEIEAALLQIAKSHEFIGITDLDKVIRIRADAADVLWRLSNTYRDEAGRIITEIGNMANNTELESTIYSNSENIHLINDKVIEYIEKIYTSVKQKFTKIDQVLTDIEIYCDKAQLSLDNISKIRRSLDRILLDCSKFSKYNLTMTTILLTIYNKIYSMPHRTHIIARLLEELIDMADTCASGHVKRIVNSLSGFDSDLVGIINIELELDANIKNAISNGINKLSNAGDILEASGSVNRELYINAIYTIYDKIKFDLQKEFVDSGLMSLCKFSKVASEIMSKL